MSNPSERTIRFGKRFIGASLVSGDSIYRVPRKGKHIRGAEPIPLFGILAEAVINPTNGDTFDVGVRFYEKPPTLRDVTKVWKGRLLAQSQTLTRVLDDEGEPLKQATDMGVFCLFEGIPGIGPKWIDVSRVKKPNTRRRFK